MTPTPGGSGAPSAAPRSVFMGTHRWSKLSAAASSGGSLQLPAPDATASSQPMARRPPCPDHSRGRIRMGPGHSGQGWEPVTPRASGPARLEVEHRNPASEPPVCGRPGGQEPLAAFRMSYDSGPRRGEALRGCARHEGRSAAGERGEQPDAGPRACRMFDLASLEGRVLKMSDRVACRALWSDEPMTQPDAVQMREVLVGGQKNRPDDVSRGGDPQVVFRHPNRWLRRSGSP